MVISGNPFLASTIIYRGHFYVHTFGYVFHGVNSHPVNWFVDFCQFCEIALVGLKTHKIGSAATALAQWCTSWSPKLLPLVRTPGVHPRGITYLLVDGLLGVRALRRGPVEAVAACFFFGGFCPWNHEPPTMGIAAALLRLRRLFFCVGGEWGVE